MNELEFKKDKSALLIIDMQNAFIHPEGSLSKMGLDTSRTGLAIKPIQQMIAAFRDHKRPVIYIQHTHQPDGSDGGMIAKVFPPIMALGHCFDGSWDQEIIAELPPQEGDYILKKSRFSAFYKTELDDMLHEMGVDQLVVTGIATNICVESTIRDAFYRDYNVFVPVDATASYTPEQEQGALGNFGFAFARLVSVDEMLKELDK